MSAAKNTAALPKRTARHSLRAATGSAVGGDFYNGIEWLACWLLDNVEGETITEEQLRPWAVEAWREHLKRQNDGTQRRLPPPLSNDNTKNENGGSRSLE